MKKNYYIPQTETLDFVCMSFLCGSKDTGDGDPAGPGGGTLGPLAAPGRQLL